MSAGYTPPAGPRPPVPTSGSGARSEVAAVAEFRIRGPLTPEAVQLLREAIAAHDAVLEAVDAPAKGAKRRNGHVFEKDPHRWYIEEHWCNRRLFAVEDFGPRDTATVIDPYCGSGRIPQAAMAAGYHVIASDVVDRQPQRNAPGIDFAICDFMAPGQFELERMPFVETGPLSIVTNPNFDYLEGAARRALSLATYKVAMLVHWNAVAAALWLQTTPLETIYILSPRPSMPPGTYIEAGGKVGGGWQNYCWLIFRKGYQGEAKVRFMTRGLPGAN